MTELNICLLGDGFVKGVGDSQHLGWVSRLMALSEQDHGPMTYYNLGIAGQTTVAVGQRVRELVPRMPKGEDNRLVLSFGVSDTQLLDNKPLLSNVESVEALHKIIAQTHSHCKMLMVGPVPVYEPQQNGRIKRLNALFHEECSKHRIPYVDLFSSLIEDVPYKRDLIAHGKFYPSGFGYNKIADLIWNDRAWWFNS